ncbi:GH3 family domain-containing protein [Fulvivirga sedimenti]|uniref:GH3 auxin-responsive promoter family protein n=1 Tax=Fulvivirga sedimenti TaxID=2879465 RepID=A0A9X1HKG9_9BACT|nr:GH3 auxin-responsive promoter family protein [Fulvivirga sedimenti]MCA6073884.1 GH3 auxin-responsive promoter family protein [Fulvivirga sedimenti]
MPFLGTLLKNGIRIRESLEQDFSDAFELQRSQLRKLLINGSFTQFGKKYQFTKILKNFRAKDQRQFYDVYKSTVPLHNYQKIASEWWYRSRTGEADVCWPGKVRFFALSSGTSDASSKYIPVTREMKKSMQKTSIRQILTLSKYDLAPETFEGGILMLGGSTDLHKHGSYFEGDLSGIQAANLPFWFQRFYKPGKAISRERNWDEKLNEICRRAHQWNISIIVGVPAWVQLLMEKIIAYYNISNIHELWPHLEVYVHGGVSFDPYRKSFGKLLGRKIFYIETYLASEGFIAFQTKPDHKAMRLVLNNGIFHEFIPFNEQNFDENGEVREGAEAVMIDQVVPGQDYALVISTNAGTWRYLIGDVIRFQSVEESEIVITGRTKHFLSMCGEHLSVDNMNKAIEMVSDELDVEIREFTVAGIPYDTLFAHHWFVGVETPMDSSVVRDRLDHFLCKLNDDYCTERSAALKEVIVDVLPLEYFYSFMEKIGKTGGQHKFPRVIKSEMYQEWKAFIESRQISPGVHSR